jgi:hypothetical protein
MKKTIVQIQLVPVHTEEGIECPIQNADGDCEIIFTIDNEIFEDDLIFNIESRRIHTAMLCTGDIVGIINPLGIEGVSSSKFRKVVASTIYNAPFPTIPQYFINKYKEDQTLKEVEIMYDGVDMSMEFGCSTITCHHPIQN